MNLLKIALFSTLLASTYAMASSERTCYVDLDKFSASVDERFEMLPDGVAVKLQVGENGLEKVQIAKGEVLGCLKQHVELSTYEMASQLLQYTGASDFDRFVGNQASVCSGVDFGWMFLIGESDAYIAYMGPYEVPLTVSALNCTVH